MSPSPFTAIQACDIDRWGGLSRGQIIFKNNALVFSFKMEESTCSKVWIGQLLWSGSESVQVFAAHPFWFLVLNCVDVCTSYRRINLTVLVLSRKIIKHFIAMWKEIKTLMEGWRALLKSTKRFFLNSNTCTCISRKRRFRVGEWESLVWWCGYQSYCFSVSE